MSDTTGNLIILIIEVLILFGLQAGITWIVGNMSPLQVFGFLCTVAYTLIKIYKEIKSMRVKDLPEDEEI